MVRDADKFSSQRLDLSHSCVQGGRRYAGNALECVRVCHLLLRAESATSQGGAPVNGIGKASQSAV